MVPRHEIVQPPYRPEHPHKSLMPLATIPSPKAVTILSTAEPSTASPPRRVSISSTATAWWLRSNKSFCHLRLRVLRPNCRLDKKLIFRFAFTFNVNSLCPRKLCVVTANGLQSLAVTHTKTTCFGQESTVISYRKCLAEQTKTSCFGVRVNVSAA